MSLERTIENIRLLLGFVLAPAVVPVAYMAILFGWCELGSQTALVLFCFGWPHLLYVGLAISYGVTFAVGTPWVACILREASPGFRAVMFPPAALAIIFGSLACVALPFSCYPGLCAVIAYGLACALTPAVPALLLSGLVFYLIAFWRSPRRPTRPSASAALAAARKDPRL